MIFLGGVGEIGKNMTAFEYGDEIIVVDAGLAFPTADMPGVDLVIPDVTYLRQNKDKVKGLILTHGHEDHIGAVPYILREFKIPVYGTRLTLGMVEHKLQEQHITDAELIPISNKSVVRLGKFVCEFVHVSHSVAGSVAVSITTPVGVRSALAQRIHKRRERGLYHERIGRGGFHRQDIYGSARQAYYHCHFRFQR